MNILTYVIAGGAALTVAGGAAFLMNDTSSKDETIVQVQQILVEPTEKQKKFQKMSIDPNQSSRFCYSKKPPKEFGTTDKETMGLQDARELLAFQKMIDEESCDCFLDQITWEQADQERQKYKTGKEYLPYDMINTLQIRIEHDNMCRG